MTVANQDHQARLVLIAISIYDGNGVPLGLYTAQVQIGKDANQLETGTFQSQRMRTLERPMAMQMFTPIFPRTAAFHSPQNNLSHSKSQQGTGNSPATGPAPSNSGNAGAYSMTFTLPSVMIPKVAPTKCMFPGTWSGYYGTATTSFNIPTTPAGDFNGDGISRLLGLLHLS